MKNMHTSLNNGSVSLLVMLFGVIASIILGGVVMLASLQYDHVLQSNAYEEALSLAESGIHYYRWHLAHSADDFTDGTGNPGPYIHEFKDTEGDVIGTFSLRITPPEPGSTIVTITSTGATKNYPTIKRTVTVRMGIPSFARYAFLHNSSVFFGAGVDVHGPVMSNGGIRQDGTNDSLLQSALATYTCGTETGCSPPEEKPGVWGSGGLQDLWKYPVPPVDFDSVTVSFPRMKSDAQNIGVYYGPSGNLGYHVVFKDDATVDIYTVTQAKTVRGMGADGKCTNLDQEIFKQTFLGNYSITSKHILFFEDTVWVEGTVNGRVTVVAARFPIDTNSIDMYINNSIRYTAKDGSSALGLISQRNIFFIKDLPDDFELDAALMAKNGAVFRHGFHVPSCGNNGNAIRTNFTLYGSVISGQGSAWNWGTPPGSGFVNRNIIHDNHLYYNPPPYFPMSYSYGYGFVSWTETPNP